MNKFSKKIHLVALVTVLCSVFAFALPVSSGNGGHINQLLYIGTVDGKSYFTEGNTTLTWQEAKTFCNSSGMHLATVKSVAQSTMLKSAYNNITFPHAHWTAGRDSGTLSQFSWDDDNETLNKTVINPFSAWSELTCVMFDPIGGNFNSCPCDFKFFILCELRHGKIRNSIET